MPTMKLDVAGSPPARALEKISLEFWIVSGVRLA